MTIKKRVTPYIGIVRAGCGVAGMSQEAGDGSLEKRKKKEVNQRRVPIENLQVGNIDDRRTRQTARMQIEGNK
jgi:hypothetical protein